MCHVAGPVVDVPREAFIETISFKWPAKWLSIWLSKRILNPESRERKRTSKWPKYLSTTRSTTLGVILPPPFYDPVLPPLRDDF